MKKIKLIFKGNTIYVPLWDDGRHNPCLNYTKPHGARVLLYNLLRNYEIECDNPAALEEAVKVAKSVLEAEQRKEEKEKKEDEFVKKNFQPFLDTLKKLPRILYRETISRDFLIDKFSKPRRHGNRIYYPSLDEAKELAEAEIKRWKAEQEKIITEIPVKAEVKIVETELGRVRFVPHVTREVRVAVQDKDRFDGFATIYEAVVEVRYTIEVESWNEKFSLKEKLQKEVTK